MTLQVFMGKSPERKKKLKKVNVYINGKKVNNKPIEVDFIKGEFVVRAKFAEQFGAKDFTKVKLEVI